MLIGYVDGQYWEVFDSYDENGDFIKHLAWDHSFAIAKRYQVKIQVQKQSQGWINFLVQLVGAAFGVSDPTPLPAPAPQPLPEPMTKYLWGT